MSALEIACVAPIIGFNTALGSAFNTLFTAAMVPIRWYCVFGTTTISCASASYAFFVCVCVCMLCVCVCVCVCVRVFVCLLRACVCTYGFV